MSRFQAIGNFIYEKGNRIESVDDVACKLNAYQMRIERLKAEVEAQAKRWAESEDLISHYKQQMDEVINDCQCSSLKAEVERLRYVGDGMAVMVGHIEVTGDAHRMMLELSKEWNAAKEGKSV